MGKSVPASVRKARLAAALMNCKKERAYCRPTLITPHRVEFSYGNYQVVFVYDTGRVMRVADGQYYQYLSEEDYAILYTIAGDLMQASFNGVKKEKKTTSEVTRSIQLELPLSGLPSASTP